MPASATADRADSRSRRQPVASTRSQPVHPELRESAAVRYKGTGNGSIPQTTISLVFLRAGQIVGNTYHTVRATDDLRKNGETEQRITAVASWRDAPYFTDAERIALEFAEAVLTPNPSGERVPTSCTPGLRAATTPGRCGRSRLRLARCASGFRSLSSASRCRAGNRTGPSNALAYQSASGD